ncbi:MAG: tRNA pseudouridine(38-40) synthase TruA [Clostridia bacterium]|nr:tRNA pseudouridine(38-40) synthase TruA [Clostridia bacterium]
MRNLKITIQYDGTRYSGWQRQKNALAVQQVLEDCISEVTGENIKVIGSGRTDSGVHALAQVANFRTDSSIPEDRMPLALNSYLPEDIRIIRCEQVDENFHARFSAKAKTYLYTIINDEYGNVLWRNYMWHIRQRLDVRKMKQAAAHLIGTKDFSSFRSSGSSTKTSVRTINDISIDCEDSLIKVWITADGFLYNMVRIIVGTLVEFGMGLYQPDYMKTILDTCDRNTAGKTAPPHGLCLVKIYY